MAAPHGLLADRRGQRCARSVPAHQNPLRVAADLSGVFARPRERGVRVIVRGGEAMLRCQAVADGSDDTARGFGQERAERFTQVEIADHEATLMEVEQQRARPVEVGRAIRAQRNHARGPRDAPLLALDARSRWPRERCCGGAHTIPRGGRRERVERRLGRAPREQREPRIERPPAALRRGGFRPEP